MGDGGSGGRVPNVGTIPREQQELHTIGHGGRNCLSVCPSMGISKEIYNCNGTMEPCSWWVTSFSTISFQARNWMGNSAPVREEQLLLNLHFPDRLSGCRFIFQIWFRYGNIKTRSRSGKGKWKRGLRCLTFVLEMLLNNGIKGTDGFNIFRRISNLLEHLNYTSDTFR